MKKYLIVFCTVLMIHSHTSNAKTEKPIPEVPFQSHQNGIPLDEFVTASSTLIGHLAAIALMPENPLIVSSNLNAIIQVMSKFLEKMKATYGIEKIGIDHLARLIAAQIYRAKPHNAMDEIDELIKNTQEKNNEISAFVLMQFASIVNDFAHIVENPHNADMVAHNITHMLASLVTIAKEAITRNPMSIVLEDQKKQFEHALLIEAQRCHEQYART